MTVLSPNLETVFLEYVVFDINQIKSNAIDNTGGSNIIESYDNIQQKRISTVSQVPDRESRLSSQEPPVEIPRYDQASMLVESGNGLGENGTNGLTKKERQLINEQVESLLESKDFSIYQDDYTLADRELMAALYWSWWKRISWWRGCWPFKRILYSSNSY